MTWLTCSGTVPERASTSTRCRISAPAVTSIRQTGARSVPALAAVPTSAGSNAHSSARPACRVGAATWCVRATRATAVRVAAAAETVRAAEDKDNGVVSPVTDRRLPSPSTATANSPPMTGRPPDILLEADHVLVRARQGPRGADLGLRLVQREQVGVPAEVRRRLALRRSGRGDSRRPAYGLARLGSQEVRHSARVLAHCHSVLDLDGKIRCFGQAVSTWRRRSCLVGVGSDRGRRQHGSACQHGTRHENDRKPTSTHVILR